MKKQKLILKACSFLRFLASACVFSLLLSFWVATWEESCGGICGQKACQAAEASKN